MMYAAKPTCPIGSILTVKMHEERFYWMRKPEVMLRPFQVHVTAV